MPTTRLWLVALLSAVLGLDVLSAFASPSPETSRFRRLDRTEGLSQASALSLAQDRDGMLWIGTQIGLNRYDGAQMRVFTRGSEQLGMLSENYIAALLSDPDGSMWVGTSSGLNRFDPRNERFQRFLPNPSDPNSLPHANVNALLRDASGSLWVASDGGVSRFQAAPQRFFNFPLASSDPRAFALAEHNGELVAGGTSGLWRLQPGAAQFEAVALLDADAKAWHGSVQALYTGADGSLWIGSKDAGLLRWSGGKLEQWRHDPADTGSLSDDRVYALLEDKTGQLWVGTEAGADLLLAPQGPKRQFAHFMHRPLAPGSIGSGRVVSIIEDRSGDLWFGSWSGGANLLSPARSRFLSFAPDSLGLSNSDSAEVLSLLSAGPSKLWLGTRRGLLEFDIETHQLTAGPGARETRVYALGDQSQELLLGTDHGVLHFNPHSASLRDAKVPQQLGTAFVNMLSVEADRVWVGTRDAELFVLDRDLKKVHARHSLEQRAHFLSHFDQHTKLLGSEKGLFWLSADGLQLRHRTRADPSNPKALQSDQCHDFLAAANGSLWVATAVGLQRMVLPEPGNPSSAQFELFTHPGGLNYNAIKSILEDARGHLWLATNAGISRFDPATQRFSSFHAADGAIDAGYYSSVRSSLPAGRLAFGGASGFTVFDPSQIGELPAPPLPLLTELALNNRIVELRDKDSASPLSTPLHQTPQLVLSPGQARSLGLTFSTPYFVAPEQLQYQYRLEGFDEQWIETDARRRLASYTNLSPGDYRFAVRVRNADAPWPEAVTQLQLRIEPFWWQTSWARALPLLAALLVVSAAFYARVRLLASQRQALSSQVAARTEHLAKLAEIGRHLTATLSFESAAERVYREVRARLDAHVFLIGIYREGAGTVELEYLMEADARRPGVSYALSDRERPAVWCVRERRELQVSNRRQLLNFVSHTLPPASGAPMESIVYLPLQIAQRVIGCLSVQSPRANAYDTADLEFLRALASYTAIALDNADNFRRLDQAMRESSSAMADLHSTHLRLTQAYAKIEQLSQTDLLTGLGNRRSLELHLPARLSEHPKLGFYLIDVDHFKAINDEHGHLTGDLVLTALGALLRKHFAEHDLLVRWGGEEFLAVAPLNAEAQALAYAEALRARVTQHRFVDLQGEPLRCTVSIGFAVLPFDPRYPQRFTWQQVVEIADAGLYFAKHSGRDQVVGYRCVGDLSEGFDRRLMHNAEHLCSLGILERLTAAV